MTVEIPSSVIAVDDEFYNSQPAWHPLQKKMVYISSLSSARNDTVAVGVLKEIDLLNNRTRAVLSDSILACSPDFSPDGNAVVFCAQDNHSRNVRILNLVTNEISAVTNERGWRTFPRWSPDGKAIAFIDDGSVTLYQLSNHRFKLPENIGARVTGISWGEDENQLIIARDTNEKIEFSLYDIRYATLSPLPISLSSDATWLSFAPLKSSLQPLRAFLIFQNSERIYLFDFKENQVVKILQSGHTPAISPQGNRVAFSQDGRIIIETLWVDVSG